MSIVNLKIEKIAIHQIFQRDGDGNKVDPSRSTELIKFDKNAMNTFKSRIVNALGENSKAVTMSILNQESHRLAPLVDKISTASEAEFIVHSYDIANKLADSQQRRNIPGGIVVVFQGKYGATPRKIVGIMKAEIHSAYEKLQDKLTREITLKYVEEALLTPATKLYKTAGFLQIDNSNTEEDLNKKWKVLVSDSQISQTDGKAAAHYFYSSFLGCGYPETSARSTKKFYDATRTFINDMSVSPEKKNDLHNALTTYLKHENSEIVNPSEFASRYFDVETRDSYAEFLDDTGLSTEAFTKDIEHIANRLKIRQLSFSKNVKVTAPSQIFKEFINIEEIREDEEGNSVNWTKIIIKDKIVSQE